MSLHENLQNIESKEIENRSFHENGQPLRYIRPYYSCHKKTQSTISYRGRGVKNNLKNHPFFYPSKLFSSITHTILHYPPHTLSPTFRHFSWDYYIILYFIFTSYPPSLQPTQPLLNLLLTLHLFCPPHFSFHTHTSSSHHTSHPPFHISHQIPLKPSTSTSNYFKSDTEVTALSFDLEGENIIIAVKRGSMTVSGL